MFNFFKNKKKQNLNHYNGFCEDNYFEQVKTNYKDLINPFWYYEKLIDDLLSMGDIEILPLKEFVKKDQNGKKQIGFRHDIDADPITAVRCARALAQRGLSGSFYFLHSAVYYGNFYNDVFVRNPKIQRWIEDIIIAGSEIGLHNDILGIYKHHGYDGIKHFKTELQWIRECGAKVEGISSHNNFLTYSAENSELFQENILLNKNRTLVNKKDSFVKNIIGKLSFQECGLTYDATFLKPKNNLNKQSLRDYLKIVPNFFDESWARTYFINNPVNDWGVDFQVWLVGRDQWILSSSKQNVFYYLISLNDVMNILQNEIDSSSKILFELHPEYFGA